MMLAVNRSGTAAYVLAESCERIAATIVFPAFRRTQIITCSPPKYPSVPLPHVLDGPPGPPLIHATCTSPPRHRLHNRLAATAACTPPARRRHAAAAFGRAPLTRA